MATAAASVGTSLAGNPMTLIVLGGAVYYIVEYTEIGTLIKAALNPLGTAKEVVGEVLGAVEGVEDALSNKYLGEPFKKALDDHPELYLSLGWETALGAQLEGKDVFGSVFKPIKEAWGDPVEDFFESASDKIHNILPW